MKKPRILIALVLMIGVLVSGCGMQNSQPKKTSVVCTSFAVFDWVTSIIKGFENKYEVTLLAGGGDIHSYQPTAQDIAKISKSDLFIYVGGVSDIWAEGLQNKNSLKLAEVLEDDLLCVEEEQHNHSHKHGDFDEHIWLSLRLAQRSVDGIFGKLAEFAQGDELKAYMRNRDEYKERLEALDLEYAETVEKSKDKTVVFADRFPFLYMMKDYGITYFAAFPGCSADSDAGFGVIADLAAAVDANKKETVLVLEDSKLSVAETVTGCTRSKDAKIAVMDSCQSITREEIQKGVSYIEIMKANLESLKMALQ